MFRFTLQSVVQRQSSNGYGYTWGFYKEGPILTVVAKDLEAAKEMCKPLVYELRRDYRWTYTPLTVEQEN